jgi:ATP-dependent DNA helicase PIF1
MKRKREGEASDDKPATESGKRQKVMNANVILTDEQMEVLNAALHGKSLFFTGAAGTGKSLLLRMMIERLRTKCGADKVFVTATTGVAAVNVSGCTLHSFAGIGLGTDDRSTMLTKITNNKIASRRWKAASVLIVDEISMLSAELFDKLEYVACAIRERPLDSFGGLQVILCGDFFQLPPISDVYNTNTPAQFCFESARWNIVVKKTFVLHRIFRQKDLVFQHMLNEIRIGEPSQTTVEALNACCRQLKVSKNGILPTRLYPHRVDVCAQNRRRLAQLKTETHVFYAHDWERDPKTTFLKRLQDNCQAPQKLELKVGAQVMLLKNLDVDLELVNGSRGVVIGFEHASDSESEDKSLEIAYPTVRFTTGFEQTLRPMTWCCYLGNVEMASRRQVPLALAWALSIHKSQGMTIDLIEMSLHKVFACGQAYVALSRATTLKGLRLLDHVIPHRIFADKKVVEFYKNLQPEIVASPILSSESSESEDEKPNSTSK